MNDKKFPLCYPSDVCELEMDPGPCEGAQEKFFYNSTTGNCQNFTYGGCGGNGNNFDSSKSCKACRPTPCPKLFCRQKCPNGRAEDKNGWPVCACKGQWMKMYKVKGKQNLCKWHDKINLFRGVRNNSRFDFKPISSQVIKGWGRQKCPFQ